MWSLIKFCVNIFYILFRGRGKHPKSPASYVFDDANIHVHVLTDCLLPFCCVRPTDIVGVKTDYLPVTATLSSHSRAVEMVFKNLGI